MECDRVVGEGKCIDPRAGEMWSAAERERETQTCRGRAS